MKFEVEYARYSSDNQREESIDTQVRAMDEFARKNNIQIIKVYKDEAIMFSTDAIKNISAYNPKLCP